MSSASRARRSFLLSCALLVAACGSDDSGPTTPVDPGPPPLHEGEDEVVFSVYVLGPDGRETLRWVGDPSGPMPESPEPTASPFVPYGRAFRIAWDPDARAAPVVGTRFSWYEYGTGEPFFLPFTRPDSVAFGPVLEYRFANELGQGGLDPADCDGGPDCFDVRRFDSGPHAFEVQSINENGRVIDTGQVLNVEVNYPPSVDFDQRDGAPITWRLPLRDGEFLDGVYAPGDTIPAGAELLLRLEGRDRLSADDPDSSCCDVRLQSTLPIVRFLGRAGGTFTRDDGSTSPFNTFFSEASDDSLLTMNVGPGDYRIQLRTIDEHGRPSPDLEFEFVGGFAPRTPTIDVVDDDALVIESFEEPVPQRRSGVPAYEREVGARRYFDTRDGRLVTDPNAIAEENRREYVGMIVRIPVSLRGEPDPRVADVDPFGALQSNGLVRAMTYALRPVGARDDDPDALLLGSLFLDDYLRTTVQGELELGASPSGWRGIEIFVPIDFFLTPWRYDPDAFDEGDALSDAGHRLFGERLRAQLGALRLQARSRTTALGSSWIQRSPAAADVAGQSTNFPIDDASELGRRSPVAEQSFDLRLRVPSTSGGAPDVLWPPVTAPGAR